MKSRRAAWSVWARSLLLLLALLLIVRTSHAQTPQETALARTLFQEGVALADKSDWVGAADRFGRAHSLKPTPGIAFNWARALAETGKVLHARELLHAIQHDESADSQLRIEASAMLETLERRMAKVRISTDREPSAEVRITVDDENWPRAAWGVTSPIDPGSHTVVCSEGDEEITRVQFDLGEGEERDLVLHLAGESAVAEPPTAAPSERRDEPRKPLHKSWMLWTAVGAVVAGGVIAGVLITKSRNGSEEASPVVGNTMPGVLRW